MDNNPHLAAWLTQANDIARAYPATTVQPQDAHFPAETIYRLATRGMVHPWDIACELRDVVDGLQEDYIDNYATITAMHDNPTLAYSVTISMQPQMQRTHITVKYAHARCTVTLDYSGKLSALRTEHFTMIAHHPDADFAHEPHETLAALVIRSILDAWTDKAVRAHM